jgi:hypothetical protein
LLLPELQIGVGQRVLFKATELKHNLHPEAMAVARTGGVLCPVERLHAYLKAAAAAGHPVTNYLCRPLMANKAGFLETSLSVAAFEEDVEEHFAAAGVAYHATLHGSRRGSLQHHARQGAPLEVLSYLAQIKTPEILQRYLDPARHLPGRLAKPQRPAKRARGNRGAAE